MKLIPDIKNYWKFWSVRLAALGTFLLTFLELAPHWFAVVWGQLPDAVTQTIPESYVRIAAIALIVGSMIARGIKQEKLEK